MSDTNNIRETMFMKYNAIPRLVEFRAAGATAPSTNQCWESHFDWSHNDETLLTDATFILSYDDDIIL